MARLFATLLLTLACSDSLHADILMRIPSFPAGDSTLPGYEGWINIDQIEFSIDRDPILGEPGSEDINIGVGRINLFHLSKPTGAASTDLFRFAINGNSMGTAEIRVVDVSPGCAVPTAAWKFDRTFVASYSTKSIGDELVDEFSFYFNKIAFAVVEEDGISAFGWDKVQNKAWTEHGLETALQNELSAAQCADPGDFTMDGIVDGADFLTWQRGASPNPTDLADWVENFGNAPALSEALTLAPEPATSVMAMWAMIFLLGRRGAASSVASRRRQL